MYDEGALLAILTIWLGLICLTGYYIVHIALLLRGQRIRENIYRLHLAARRGKAVREAEGQRSEAP